ncbi:hypothetical protein ACFL0L_04485 [Patescibacteria group bacterium]
MNTQHPAYFLYRSKLLIIIGTVIITLSSLVFALLAPVKHDTSISFTIDRASREETEDYQFDGYYAIQAADLFSQTVLSWFLTPSILLEIYDQAGIDPEISSIEQLTTRFKAKKYSAQNIVVRFKERDRGTADKISAALTTVVEERASHSNQTSEQKSVFTVTGETPVIVEQSPSVVLTTIIGFVAGLIATILLAYVVSMFRFTQVPSSDHP